MIAGIDADDARFLVTMGCVLLIAAFAAVGCAMQPFLDRRRDAGAGFRWVKR